jgi:hypothetical protein
MPQRAGNTGYLEEISSRNKTLEEHDIFDSAVASTSDQQAREGPRHGRSESPTTIPAPSSSVCGLATSIAGNSWRQQRR